LDAVREENEVDWKKLTRPDRVLVMVALLFAFDVLVIPWINVSFGPFSSTGTGRLDGLLRGLVFLLAIGVAISVILKRTTTIQLLSFLVSSGGKFAGAAGTRVLGALGALGLVVLTRLLHFNPSYLGPGSWAALVLGSVLVVLVHRSSTRATGVTADGGAR
jgi:hypothetical protein